MLYIKGYHKTLQGKNFIMVFEIDGCPNLKAIEEFHSKISKNSFRVGSPLSDLPFSFLFFAKWSKGFQFLVHEFPIAVLFPTPLSTLFPSSLCCPLVHCHSAWHTCQLLFFFFFFVHKGGLPCVPLPLPLTHALLCCMPERACMQVQVSHPSCSI